jgi:glycogen(starch) synthase
MKILIYSHYFAPSVGGVESIVISLARGLTEYAGSCDLSPISVTVVTQTEAGVFQDDTLPFVVFRRPSLFRLFSLVSSSDVIHVAGPALAPMIASYVLHKPLVIEHHGYQSVCLNGLLIHQPERSVCSGYFMAKQYSKCLSCQTSETSSFKAALSFLAMFPRRFLASRAATNIAVSRHVVDRVALPNTRAIYHGIEDNLTHSGSPRLPNNTTFACLGRFVPEKGIPVLLEACVLLKKKGFNFTVRLIGDGPQRQRIEKIIADKSLEDLVTITGFLTGPALDDALLDVDALVMPSVWEETAGLSAIEHMMRGRLVIASAIGGLSEMVGEAGLLSTPGSPESVADCMCYVIQNPSCVDTLGRKARARALELFSRRRMIDDHLNVYSRVLPTTR